MAYQILSLGDAEMLYNTYQGVAMIFSSDNMRTLAKMGFLIGLFIVVFRYYFDLKFQLQSLLIGYIVYAIMFVPKSTVIIEDVYTSEVYPVANVPLGIAVPTSIVTTMGYNITKLFETAFSIPEEADMLQTGYLDPLKTLAALRYITLGTASSDADINGDLAFSLNEYIGGCVMYDIHLDSPIHEVTRESLMKADDLWAAMKTTFIYKDVLVNLDSTGILQMSCKDAYKAIDDYINNPVFSDAWDRYLHTLVNKPDLTIPASEYLQGSIDALGMAGVDAQTYMRNALMASFLRDGPSAFLTRTGMEQLKVQWAAERNIFTQIARPLMAFVEVLTVAISPIMAFLVCLGLVGISMVAKYFQMLVWVALWGPLTAVCNLYIAIVTNRAMTLMAQQSTDNGTSLAAMISHDQIYNTLETWISTGGMLASSVPAISLMLVYGGSVAATNLAGRMTAGASSAVKPERLAPEPAMISPSMTVEGQHTFNAYKGGAMNGITQPTYMRSQTINHAQQSSLNALQSAQKASSKAFIALTQRTDSHGNTVSTGTTITDLLSNSSSVADRQAASVGRQIGEKYGRTDAEKELITANASAQLALGASSGGNYKPFNLEMGGQGDLRSNADISASRQKELNDAINKDWKTEHVASFENRRAHDVANSSSNQSIFQSQEMKAKGENYMAQLQRVEQAQQTYSETMADSQAAAKTAPMDYGNLGFKLMTSGANVDLSNIDRDIQMGDEGFKAKYNKAYQDALKEISYSGALPSEQSLKGDNYIGPSTRETVARFLALDAVAPEQALKLINDKILPTNRQPESSLQSAGQFKEMEQSPNAIVSQDQANEFELKATGQTQPTAPQSPSSSQPGNFTTTGRPVHASPTERGAVGAKEKLSSEILDLSTSVGQALKNRDLGDPDAYRAKITGGSLLDQNQDVSHLMGNAVRNQGRNIYGNAVEPAVHTIKNATDLVVDKIHDVQDFIRGAGGSQENHNQPHKPYVPSPDEKPVVKDDELPNVKK